MDYCRLCGGSSSSYFCGTDCAFKDRLSCTPLNGKLDWIKYIIKHIEENDTNFYDCNSTALDPILKYIEILQKEVENPTPPDKDEG